MPACLPREGVDRNMHVSSFCVSSNRSTRMVCGKVKDWSLVREDGVEFHTAVKLERGVEYSLM